MSVFNILSIHTLSNPSLEPLDSAEMNGDLSQRNKKKIIGTTEIRYW